MAQAGFDPFLAPFLLATEGALALLTDLAC